MDLLSLHKPYQARQVMAWLVKGVTDWDRMSDLPLKDRTRFKEEHICTISSHIVDRQDDRSAVKLLVQLEDKALIECVMLSDGTGRKTACISSQVGCAMGCAFCKTGTMGLVRNLKDYEIVEQMVHLRTLDPTIGHIVFMGMGEPLHNLGALMSAITYFHNPKLFNISYRKMTVSTCGLVPGIRSLGELDLGIRLAVSLVSADDETRSRIMRVNRTYPLSELKKARQHHTRGCKGPGILHGGAVFRGEPDSMEPNRGHGMEDARCTGDPLLHIPAGQTESELHAEDDEGKRHLGSLRSARHIQQKGAVRQLIETTALTLSSSVHESVNSLWRSSPPM